MDEDIKFVISSTIPDLSEFNGRQVKIEGWEIKDCKSFFDPDTNEKIVEPVMVKKLRVFTEPVTYGTNSNKEQFPIRASILVGMKKDKQGNWGLSTNPNSTIQKLLNKYKINTLKELKDKYVEIELDNNGYLKIRI